MPKRNKPLTQADKEAAKRLLARWKSEVAARRNTANPLTQERMADKFASVSGRGSQGLVSQYLNAHIPLNYRALLAFSEELGCAPEEIRRDLPEQQLQSAAVKRRVEEPASPAYDPRSHDITELRLVIGLFAKVLASTIQPAGRQLLAELEKLPAPVKNREFVRLTVEAVRSELPDQSSSHRARGSGARKSQ